MQGDIDGVLRNEHQCPQRGISHTIELVNRQLPDSLPERKIDQVFAICDDNESALIERSVYHRPRHRQNLLFTRACDRRGGILERYVRHSLDAIDEVKMTSDRRLAGQNL